MHGLAKLGLRPARGATFTPVVANGVPAEWVSTPDVEEGRFILYIHGGAWVAGSVVTHRHLAVAISRASQAQVLLIDYRLAPENPFPAGLQDCLAAYRWLLEKGNSPAQLGIAGDSAGGNLALSLLLCLKESGDPLPAAAACLSPATVLTGRGEKPPSNPGLDILLNPEAGRKWVEDYLAGQDPSDPRVSPLLGELHGLPPILIQVGSDEMLLDDSMRFAEKARAAGVDIKLDVWPGMWHVWQAFTPFMPEARQAIVEIGEFFRQHLKS